MWENDFAHLWTKNEEKTTEGLITYSLAPLNQFYWWEEQKHEIRFQISIQIVDFIPILWNDP